MLTEFGGEPVAGGTLPAHDLEGVHREARTSGDGLVVRRAALSGRADRRGSCSAGAVAARQRLLPRRAARRVLLRARPPTEADCKPNEVSVPRVVGMTRAAARERARAQPLGATSSYIPREGRQDSRARRRPGAAARRVCPATSNVRLVGTDGQLRAPPEPRRLEPRRRAAARSEAAQARLVGRGPPGRAGTVCARAPEPGVAVAPGLRVRLVVGDG